MKKPTITAVVLAKNESTQIERALSSLRWTDEIVVVDDYSTDDTAKICKKHGAKVFKRRLDSFAAQRNFGISKATKEWVLIADADEVFSDILGKEIRSTLESETYAGLRVGRAEHFLGRRFIFQKPEAHVLRVGRACDMKYAGVVHEVPRVSGLIGAVQNRIEHYSYPNLSDWVRKTDQYTTLIAKETYAREGVLPHYVIVARLLFNPVKYFGYYFFAKKLLFQGLPGWIFSILSGFSAFLADVKYIELAIKNKKH